MDGYEVARRLRAEHAGCRLVALTGYGRDEDRERSRDAGFDHHLVKPVDLEELARVVG
jgi:CheY-like chemotaxis protein